MMRNEWRVQKLAWLPLAFGLTVVLAGCAGSSGPAVLSEFFEFSPEEQSEIAARSAQPYRIQTEDILKVTVSDQKELREDAALVLPDGAISLVGAGRVKIAGLTVGEADSAITLAYAHNIKEPDVSVVVRETKGTRVYVLGQVRSPGMQTLPSGGMSVFGAVSLAGGFTEDAAPEGTVLVRVNPTGYLVQEVDLTRLDDAGGIGLAMLNLQPLDVVYVPRSRIGDFGYFTKNVLVGLVSLTRMAVDFRYLSTGTYRGF